MNHIKVNLLTFMLLAFSFCFFASCTREVNIQPPIPIVPCLYDCDTSKLEIVWQELLAEDSTEAGDAPPIIYQNNVLIHKKFHGPYGLLKMRDGKTGKSIWEWEDTEDVRVGDGIAEYKYLKDNILCTAAHSDYYAVDLETGKTLWETHMDTKYRAGSPRSTGFLDFVFHPYEHYDGKHYLTTLRRARITDGQWEKVITLKTEKNYIPSVESMAGMLHPTSGDTILFFQNRQWNPYDTPQDGKIDLYAYNLTADSILWLQEDIEPAGISNIHPLLVEDGRVYFMGFSVIGCFDAQKGTPIWKKNGIGGPTGGMTLVSGRYLLTNPNDFYVIDINNGQLLRRTPVTGNNSNMVVHDGIAYFTSAGDGKLYAIDYRNGGVIWAEKAPNRKKKGFYNANFAYAGVALNPELGLLYTSDGYFAMCVKMLKR